MEENKQMNDAPRRRGRPPNEPSIDTDIPMMDTPREGMRAAVREEDPRARAARRAAELRGHLRDMDEGTDEFYVDPSCIPDGWSYEWKVKKVLGAEDPSRWTQTERMGWTAVPLSRHRNMMPSNWDGAFIERKGMVLMERPEEITQEARDIERRRARDQVRAKEQQLAGTPEGTMTRDHDRVRPSIKKSYSSMPIPNE